MAVVKSAHVEEECNFPDRDDPSKRVHMNKWAVVVDDNGQEVTKEMWLLTSEKYVPSEGDEVVVVGKKVKRPPRNRSNGNRSGGGGKGWQPRLEDDPVVYAAKQAAIAAQTSLERAIDFADRRGDLADKNVDDDVLVNRIIVIAGKFEDHISERARAAGTRVREAAKP